MILKGTPIQLRHNTFYKDEPEKSQDKWYGDNKLGSYQQFQVLDMNFDKGKANNGFLYVQVFTDLDLHVEDVVTVKDILYVMKKGRNTTVMGVTIHEKSIVNVEDIGSDECGY